MKSVPSSGAVILLLISADCVVGRLPVVCNLSLPSSMLLSSTHLQIGGIHDPPYGVRNASAEHGFSGFDMELLSIISRMLNFTFEVIDVSPDRLNVSTWDDVLHDSLLADKIVHVVLTWWTPNADRYDHYAVLRGHVDGSRILVAPTADIPVDPWVLAITEKFDSFLQ